MLYVDKAEKKVLYTTAESENAWESAGAEK